MKTTRLVAIVAVFAVALLAAALPTTAQQGPIKIGEINSFSGIGRYIWTKWGYNITNW